MSCFEGYGAGFMQGRHLHHIRSSRMRQGTQCNLKHVPRLLRHSNKAVVLFRAVHCQFLDYCKTDLPKSYPHLLELSV